MRLGVNIILTDHCDALPLLIIAMPSLCSSLFLNAAPLTAVFSFSLNFSPLS
jgi:hypothetical protein